MKCYISEREVDPSIVGPPAMNYGQHWRWTALPKHQYRYEMSIAEFVLAAGGWFDRCSKELEADRRADPPLTFPELDELEALGFPTLEVMLAQHPAALARLMCWFNMDLNDVFGGLSYDQPVYYSTNSLEWFTVERDCVGFGGIAYESRKKT